MCICGWLNLLSIHWLLILAVCNDCFALSLVPANCQHRMVIDFSADKTRGQIVKLMGEKRFISAGSIVELWLIATGSCRSGFTTCLALAFVAMHKPG